MKKQRILLTVAVITGLALVAFVLVSLTSNRFQMLRKPDTTESTDTTTTETTVSIQQTEDTTASTQITEPTEAETTVTEPPTTEPPATETTAPPETKPVVKETTPPETTPPETETTAPPTQETAPKEEETPSCDHVYGEETPLGRDKSGFSYLKTCTLCYKDKIVTYDALLTFVDDDAKTQAAQHWERIIDETGIPMTMALIPSKIGETTDYNTWWSYAGWDVLDRLRNKGVDFVNHTYNHKNLTTLTEEEIHADLQNCKETLLAHGISSNILVYPNNAYNDTVVGVVENYFDVGVTCLGKLNTKAFSINYSLYRLDSTSAERRKSITFDEDRIVDCDTIKSESRLQAELTNAVKNKGWCIYMTHAYDSPSGKFYFDETAEQTIINFCRYAQGMENVKIVSLTEGVTASAPLTDSE